MRGVICRDYIAGYLGELPPDEQAKFDKIWFKQQEAKMQTKELAIRAAAASLNGQAAPNMRGAVREAETILGRDLAKEERAAVDAAVNAMDKLFNEWRKK